MVSFDDLPNGKVLVKHFSGVYIGCFYVSEDDIECMGTPFTYAMRKVVGEALILYPYFVIENHSIDKMKILILENMDKIWRDAVFIINREIRYNGQSNKPLP